MRLRNENQHTSGFIPPNQRVRFCLPFVWEKTPHLTSAAMANEPIDSTAPSASNNNIALAPSTTNPSPTPNESLSSPSKEEEEKLNRSLKKARATISPPLGQFFITTILQIATFNAAIAFGVSAIKSINIARTANEYSASANSYASQALEEALLANQVAMLAVCLQPGATQVCCCLVVVGRANMFL